MKTTTKHTPVPWETGSLMSTVTAPRLNAPVPIFIADCGTKNAPNSEAERCANAAFIVRVCNSHEELLEALRTASLRLDEANRLLGIKPEAEWFIKYRDEARAAIAKAERGEP